MVTVAAYETLLVALLVLGNLWLLLWGAYHTVLKRESAILILNKQFGENMNGNKKTLLNKKTTERRRVLPKNHKQNTPILHQAII